MLETMQVGTLRLFSRNISENADVIDYFEYYTNTSNIAENNKLL